MPHSADNEYDVTIKDCCSIFFFFCNKILKSNIFFTANKIQADWNLSGYNSGISTHIFFKDYRENLELLSV